MAKPKIRIPVSERADPMPRHIRPMLALLSGLPTDAGNYGFEYKWDGVRALCYWDGTRIRFESRNLIDITPRYPELAGLGKSLKNRAVLDGEIVALDPRGRPDFSLLQQRMGIADERAAAGMMEEIPIAYFLFDVLYLDRRSTMVLPYRERRALLEGLSLAGPNWRTTPCHRGEGAEMLEAAEKSGLEGVVAKRLTSLYEPGERSGAWRKIKTIKKQEFVIGGWVPEKGSFGSRVGALLLGYYEQGKGGSGRRLCYAGSVGTGFSENDRLLLSRSLKPLGRRTSPFDGPAPRDDARYVTPELVAEIEYREWTPKGMLRQPSFKGMRFDKPADEVVREDGNEAEPPFPAKGKE